MKKIHSKKFKSAKQMFKSCDRRLKIEKNKFYKRKGIDRRVH